MKRSSLCFVLAGMSLILGTSVYGDPKGKGGQGPGPHRGGPGDFHETIHALFDSHGKIQRKVELTEKGYAAVTTSEDEKVASFLQKHVGEMETRMEQGMGVRHWDPAFAELREYYDQLDQVIENVDGGVRVEVKGTTPEAILVAKNHAKIISGFVADGKKQMHESHPAVVAQKTSASAEDAPKEKGCLMCQAATASKEAGECEACKKGADASAKAGKKAEECAECQKPGEAKAKKDEACAECRKPAEAKAKKDEKCSECQKPAEAKGKKGEDSAS